MRARWIGLATFGLVMGGAAAAALAWPLIGAATAPPSLEELARQAVEDEDPAEREAAVTILRGRGIEGHEALMRVHANAVDALRAGHFGGDPTALRHAVDVVSGQRDGHASGLYWHTDLEAAQRVAQRTGRPILSLRLLGQLDEELSCANSRFFRIVLYSDPEVASVLREQFVLHWSSERPAPRIEIDMGDGRRMVRTITGNSAHYVLDASGRPVDAIVGLYGPSQFRRVLGEATSRWRACAPAPELGACLAAQHREAGDAQRQAWGALRRRHEGLPAWDALVASMPDGRGPGGTPSAVAAMPLTVSKAWVETPMLDLIRRGPAGAAAPTREPDWSRVAALSGHGIAPLSARTRALLRLKAGRDGLDRRAADLAANAAEDGARNEVLFHRRVHAWFVEGDERIESFETLNARVYTELMRTPASDPWLGLRAGDLYDALEVAR